MPVKKISDTRIEMVEGGGCLSIFGLPFFAAGIFMVLAASGLLPVEGLSDMGIWGRPILASMGLIFTAVGGWLVFGRTRILIDTVQGSLMRNRGLLFISFQSQSFDLKTFHAVELGFEAGDSDSADAYPVILKNADAAASLRISSGSNYAASLEAAKQLAIFLQLPMEDASSDHKTILQAEDVEKPLIDRLRKTSDADMWAVRPLDLQSSVDILPGRLHIRIPRRKFRLIMLIAVLIPLMILYYILPDLIDFFDRTRTPETVQWIFTGFLLLMFALLPVISVISAMVGSLRGHTGVLIADGRISITEQQAWTRKVIVIPDSDITGLDYGTVEESTETAARTLRNRKLTDSPAYASMPPRPLPGWARALSRLAKSKGITIKHRQGLYTIGAGLPDDEVKYIYSVIRRGLAGR